MGNQLVAVAPAQIFPVEHYMSDLTDFDFDSSLGSTRFMKVARAKCQSNLFVVKVFTIQDPSIDLKKDVTKLIDIRKSLEGCLNCLPFQRPVVTERAGFLIRQYFKVSLYDRLSTRPFLTLIEKKWMAFQLLLALQQIHKHAVCHGDIKMENLMVSSWNWLVLTDFASFKPTFLPEDNPADFSYFFDTSRRRTCYLAPERFKTRTIELSAEGGDGAQDTPNALEVGDLTPSMDIFSAGCVIIELFLDATSHPFSFSQLLAYRAGEYEPTKVLDKLEDEDKDIKQLASHMIQKDPGSRRTASEYLTSERGRAFPDYFYTFMLSYMQSFAADPTMTPDQKIERIHDSMDKLFSLLDDDSSDFDSPGLVLICSLMTSNIRSLKFCGSKTKCLAMLGRIASKVKSEIVLDRILPYVMTQLSDRFPAVRIAALTCLIDCIKAVKSLPLSDANIFPEYILPTLMPLCHDRNDLVRAAFAANISTIALEAVRFLDIVLLHGSNPDRPMPTYENELNVLHDLISQVVHVLLADNCNAVKQSLMENSVTQLAVFFGKPKANDIILSYMITFLNDKEDCQIRISFYENIVGVAAFVGQECSPILLPLLQQGLSDQEEFVVTRCIGAMSSLTDLDLLQKSALYELLKDTAPYLLHPNLWIRHATAGFLASAAKNLDIVDTMVKLGNILESFLVRKLVQLDEPYLILSNVQAPIPRQIYDGVVRTNPELLSQFLDFIERRKTSRSLSKSGLSSENELSADIKSIFKRLSSEGMTSDIEDKLLFMKDKLIKISRQKSLGQKILSPSTQFSEGVLDLNQNIGIGKEISLRTAVLADPLNQEQNYFDYPPSQQHFPKSVNEEWSQMFGAYVECGSETKAQGSPMMVRQVRQSSSPPTASHEKNSANEESAPCKMDLEELIAKKKREFAEKSRGKIVAALSERLNAVVGWKPKGILVAHLHEHQGGISKLLRIPEKSVFASASVDGCVRLWDCSKFEGSNLANKAHRIYSNNDNSPLTSMAVDSKGELLATGAENGSICIFRLDGKIVTSKRISVDDEGPPVELSFLETAGSPLLLYATAFGGVVGLDFRQRQAAFKVETDLRHGIQTAFAVSSGDQCWAVSGTSSGVLTCWDLRFLLPVVSCTHPSESRVRALFIPNCSSAHSGSVLASVQGNNEVGLWNLETKFRELVLWASSTPPLSTSAQTSLSQTISAIHSIRNSDMNVVFTAGTDMRIRLWNLKSPQESLIVSPASNEVINPALVSYRSKVVEGTEVIQEIHAKPKTSLATASTPGLFGQNSELSVNKPGLEPPSQGHLDWISSLTLCKASRWYVVSGSKDGVIKVWK